MTLCCPDSESKPPVSAASVSSGCCAGADAPRPDTSSDPLAWFAEMIPNCLTYARQAREEGRPIVGILCEFTPRELIMAAGAVPVCLCGGSAETIPAAEAHLPANLCPLIKSTYGYHLSGSNPFIEMASLLVAETTCDGKKKMYELMAQRRPMYVLELPQKPDDDDAFRHWRRELEKFKSHLEERFETTITDERIADAVYAMNRERRLRRELAGLMRRPDPPLTGRQLLELKTSVSVIPEALKQYEAALRILKNGQSRPGPRQPVRVLMTGVPMVHGAERVINIVEDRGGLVACMESCVGLKPILEDVEEATGDWLDALARKYFHLPCSVMTGNDRRLELIRELARDYRADCVIELIWQACLTYDVESHRVRTLVENELNLPYLRIETDYSPSDSARIAVRVEALFEMVRAAGQEGSARNS